MTRHYFYAPSKDRASHRKGGVIAFELKAFYADKAYSDKLRREVTNFHVIDDIDVLVNTKTQEYYRFTFDVLGKDTCQGHSATSYKELKESLAGNYNNFRPIREKDYFRLRALALKLMFKHTNFKRMFTGRNEYYYARQDWAFSDQLRLTALHFHHALDPATQKHRQWRREVNIPNYNVKQTEEVTISFDKASKDGSKSNYCRFSLERARRSSYSSFSEALRSIFYREDQVQVTLPQYERLHKIVKHVIWERSELDISGLKGPQTYSVRILDL
jgi:hypothetical protein